MPAFHDLQENRDTEVWLTLGHIRPTPGISPALRVLGSAGVSVPLVLHGHLRHRAIELRTMDRIDGRSLVQLGAGRVRPTRSEGIG
jgi:hypothetical protein